MYLTWTAIYAPLAIYYYASNEVPVIKAVPLYIRGVILTGENYKSWPLWYLLSTIYTLIIIGVVLKKAKKPVYAFTVICISASVLSVGITEIIYYNGNPSSTIRILQKLIKYTLTYGRLFDGITYIPIGMLLAYKKIPRFINWLCLIIGFLANYYIENTIISSYLLMLTAIALFGIVKDIELKNHSVFSKLRKMSTIIYLIHMYIWTFYYKIVYGKPTYGLDSFLITSCLAVVIAAAYTTMEKRFKDR